MIDVTLKLYDFDELSLDSKEKAFKNWRDNESYEDTLPSFNNLYRDIDEFREAFDILLTETHCEGFFDIEESGPYVQLFDPHWTDATKNYPKEEVFKEFCDNMKEIKIKYYENSTFRPAYLKEMFNFNIESFSDMTDKWGNYHYVDMVSDSIYNLLAGQVADMYEAALRKYFAEEVTPAYIYPEDGRFFVGHSNPADYIQHSVIYYNSPNMDY